MDISLKKSLFDFLSQYATENKVNKINEIILNRTRYISIILEDLSSSHNASAIVRSTECFGVQDINIIERRHEFFATNSISKGSAKWVNFNKYKDTISCIKDLKAKGYKIVATSPHKKTCSLDQLDISQKVAIMFGSEKIGLSSEAMELADEFVAIDMFGFTESFNISVSVAICLYEIMKRVRNSNIDWKLSEEELLDIKLSWLRNIVRGSKIIEKKFFEG